MKHILGIGEYAIVKNLEDEIITYALGSCVAVLIYCADSHVAAMAHVALPEPLAHMGVQRHKPAYFATEIVPLMLNLLGSEYRCHPRQLLIHVIGGAVSRSEKDPFQVGRRNVRAVSDILRHHQLPFTANNVGGHLSRTVSFSLSTGALEIKTQEMMI